MAKTLYNTGINADWLKQIKDTRNDAEQRTAAVARANDVLAKARELGILSRDSEACWALLDTDADKAEFVISVERCIGALLASI